MSAWIVTKKHVDLLVTAALASGLHDHTLRVGVDEIKINHENADLIGSVLWVANHKSVNYRYNEARATPSYVWKKSPAVDPVVVLKQILCFEYQSNECESWEKSWAHQFCEQLHGYMISMLPGYDAAPWGIEN